MKSITFFAILLLIIYPAATSYSPAMALQMGYLSGAAYETSTSIEAWSCSYCRHYNLTDVKVFSNTIGGIQGFTAFSHSLNAVLVVFRGSSNIQNWILNIGTTRSSYSLCTGCSVHTGFSGGYNLVASAVKTGVQNLKAKYRGSKLYVTGHSLGGALAILCTADLKNVFGTVDLTYTFGQPRVGNQAFADWFEATHPNTFRLVDYADIVTHLPPSSFGFVHNNKQIWYQRGMQSYQICSAQAPQCANSVGTTNYSTDDHNLDNYIKLKALTEAKQISFEKLASAAFKPIKNLRERRGESSSIWADEQLRKVNEILGVFGEEYTYKI